MSKYSRPKSPAESLDLYVPNIAIDADQAWLICTSFWQVLQL